MRHAAPLTLLALLCAALLAGCGGSRTSGTRAATTVRRAPVQPTGLRIGVVGPLAFSVPGAVAIRGTLGRVAGEPLVLVAGSAPGLADVAAAHPTSHFALVGRSYRTSPGPNVAGLVYRETQAAYLAGIVAGLAVQDGGTTDERVAWVGPELGDEVTAFEGGARQTVSGLVVLHGYTRPSATLCKEAALGVVRRGAGVLLTPHRSCADGVLAAAREQNVVGLTLDDFESPQALATQAVEDAVAGRYHGAEDVIYDASSGAIAVRRLDPHLSATTVARARAAAQDLANGLRSPR